ncbi:MAG: hypothetical protein ABI999_08040 [Acidobacteriota bacterium]
MKNVPSPLDNIRVASPCPADWNQMFGNDRKRFCGQCKLNVYNLSDMTRAEAEALLLNSEGRRLCVRYYQRADGTVLTQNCPVGWQAAKRRASNIVTAAFSVVAGLITGILGFNFLQGQAEPRTAGNAILQPPSDQIDVDDFPGGRFTMGERAIMGNVAPPIRVRSKGNR